MEYVYAVYHRHEEVYIASNGRLVDIDVKEQDFAQIADLRSTLVCYTSRLSIVVNDHISRERRPKTRFMVALCTENGPMVPRSTTAPDWIDCLLSTFNLYRVFDDMQLLDCAAGNILRLYNLEELLEDFGLTAMDAPRRLYP